MKTANNELVFAWCELCGGVYVQCPICGNNTCNGAAGRVDLNGKPLPWNAPNGKGKTCPTCLKTYELVSALEKSGCMKMIEDLIPAKHTLTRKEWENSWKVAFAKENKKSKKLKEKNNEHQNTRKRGKARS